MPRTMTRQESINAFCRQCIYDPYGGRGTWREQVAACTARTCPLYAYRPLPDYSGRASATEQDQAATLPTGEGDYLPDGAAQPDGEHCSPDLGPV